jgi:hypothetical protein
VSTSSAGPTEDRSASFTIDFMAKRCAQIMLKQSSLFL